VLSGSEKRILLVVVAATALAFPAAAAASFDVAISETESADPVQRGAPVTYTTTMVNEGTEPFRGLGLDLFSVAPGKDSAVPNPYLSVSATQGACVIEPAGDYQQVLCSLGSLAPGASVQVTAVAEANVSMDHVAGLLARDFGPDSCVAFRDQDPSDDARERTTVIVPPELEGSRKVKLKGLPDGCVRGDVVVKVKVKSSAVKGIKAKLLGKDVRERLGRSNRKRLRFTVPGSELEQAFLYDLNVNVIRRGKPGLKRTVELQAC
jgi:Domain of unknown function DUF11